MSAKPEAKHGALVRGDDGNLHVRHFATAAEATEAAKHREFSMPNPPRALRPAAIEQIYGIPKSTLRFYCTELPEAERLPSIKLPGRKPKGATKPTQGARLVLVADLEAWLLRYRSRATTADRTERKAS